MEERVGTDGETARVDAQYVWHPEYIDALAMRYWDSDATNGPDANHYYLQDANYNDMAIVNSTSAVVERYTYSAYGTPRILDGDDGTDLDWNYSEWYADSDQTASDIGNVYLYTGREYDWETRLQLNRNRYYASHLGRWLTRDPLGDRSRDLPTAFIDGSISLVELKTIDIDRVAGHSFRVNLYQYVSSDPLGDRDPSGLINWWWPFNGQVCNDSDHPILVWGGGLGGNDGKIVLPPGECTPDDLDADSIYDPTPGCWRKAKQPLITHYWPDGHISPVGCDRGGHKFKYPQRPCQERDGKPLRRYPSREDCSTICDGDPECIETCISN